MARMGHLVPMHSLLWPRVENQGPWMQWTFSALEIQQRSKSVAQLNAQVNLLSGYLIYFYNLFKSFSDNNIYNNHNHHNIKYVYTVIHLNTSPIFYQNQTKPYLQFIQGLTVSGKSGANGPTATPLALVPENSATEPARLPCSEATTVLATQLRRLHALIPAINHLAKTPPVQVCSDTF